MKIVELNLNKSVLGSIDTEDKINILSTGVMCYENMIEYLAQLQQYIKQDNTSVDDGLDLLMLIEPITTMNISYIEKFNNYVLGTNNNIRRRVLSFITSYRNTVELVEKNTSIFLPFTKDELQDVIDSLSNTVGNLICFLFYQFGFSDLYLVKDIDEVQQLNDVMDMYMRKNGISLETVIQMARNMRVELIACNPIMNVFEKYPEYLDSFVELIGEDLYDCQDATPTQIKAVVEGDLTVEELMEQLADV